MSDPVFDGNSSTRIWDHLMTLRDWVVTKIASVTPTPASFATTWSAGAALSIGNGTLTCRYMKVGRMVVASYYLLRGSTSNIGSGNYVFTLPVEAFRYQSANGSGAVFRSGSGAFWPFNVVGVGTASIGLVHTDTRARVSNSSVAWATGDEIAFTVVYEAAF